MRKLLLIPLMLMLALAAFLYATASKEEKAYYEALSNFTYVDDVEDEYKVYSQIDSPFSGDCEDFAFTLQHQIGGEVWAVSRNTKVDHAVLVTKGYVYDSLKTKPIKTEDYENRLIFVMTPPVEIIKVGE